MQMAKLVSQSALTGHNMYFRSLVSIQGPEGYGPSTLPLRHSEATEDVICLFLLAYTLV